MRFFTPRPFSKVALLEVPASSIDRNEYPLGLRGVEINLGTASLHTKMFARRSLRALPVYGRFLTTAATPYTSILLTNPNPSVTLITLNRPKALNGALFLLPPAEDHADATTMSSTQFATLP